MDTDHEVRNQIRQFRRLKDFGIKSVLRVHNWKFWSNRMGADV